MQIRSFVEADYTALTKLHNQAYGDFAKYVDELRFRDTHYPEGFRWARWTATNGQGDVVGFAEYHNELGLFHPRKFQLDIAVDQRACSQGIGTRLYQTVVDALAPFEPITLASWARADAPVLTDFFVRRGFEPNAELYTSALDVAGFDAGHWQPHLHNVLGQGLQVCSLEELGLEDADVRRRVYDLWCEVRLDLPIPPGEKRSEALSFETFWEMTCGPGVFPSGYFIALDGGQFVGTSQLFLSPLSGVLRTGVTGVRRAYRRRGVALGLKVRALSYAQVLGYRQIVTDNAAINVGMLAINSALGFKRNPVWTRYLKRWPA
jgi:GNAT superfamily N-acetyltransferase